MRVRVLPSALEVRLHSSVEQERHATNVEGAGSNPAGVTNVLGFVGLVGHDSGLVNRQRWFESGTKLLTMPRWSSGYDLGLPNRWREFDSHMTIDHIIPRSRGGRTVPENLCAACFACNQRKGNRTPEEARMPLLSNPSALTYGIERPALCQAAESRPEWHKYLFLDDARTGAA